MMRSIVQGSALLFTTFCIVGFFGYTIFCKNPRVNEILSSQNLLSAPFHENLFMNIAFTVLTFSFAICCPLCLLAAKDALEMLVFKGNGRMTSK